LVGSFLFAGVEPFVAFVVTFGVKFFRLAAVAVHRPKEAQGIVQSLFVVLSDSGNALDCLKAIHQSCAIVEFNYCISFFCLDCFRQRFETLIAKPTPLLAIVKQRG
jgi:hypothetical protein